jgi:imidazolonepropionase-like amidohydrolase
MKKLALAFLFAAIPLLGLQSSQIVVILGATLIDGTGRPAIKNAAIVIENGRIRDAGPRGNVRIPANVRTIDGKDKFVIPGLIDAHVHFFQSGDIYTRPDVIDLTKLRPYRTELDWIKERLPVTFARYLASGITGVVDVGGPMWNYDVRDIAGNTKIAPRVAVAGPLISTYVPPALQTTPDPPIIKATSPEHARELVRRQLDRKPDLIKIWFIHRPGENLEEQSAIVRATIDESHTRGFRVAVHATELLTAKIALQAGADVLVHSVTDRLVDNEFINLVKKNDVLYMTTLVVEEGYREVLNQEVRLTDIEQKLGDPQVIASWSELGKIPPADIPGGLRRRQPREARPIAFQNLALLDSAGVRIVGATDAGNIGTLHGPALHREFELMVEAGIRPMEVLISATKNAAAVMGRQGELGTLEKGKLADLLVLDADPLVDIKNARRISRIMKAGEWIEITPEMLK